MTEHFATPHPSFSLLAFRWGCVLTVLLGNTLQAEESWWQFRGPHGDGHTAATNLPFKWSENDHVAWKTKIHDRGWSSPVIWGDQIWVTTATRDGHRLFAVCINKDTGRIVHDLHLFDVEQPMKITDENTYATPTPVIEQGRVFVHYGTYGTACLDTTTGRKIWTRRDLNCDHEANAGPASSPTLIAGQLVVHVDGRDVQYIIALDRATGKTLWKTNRSIDFTDIPVHHRKAFCMPCEMRLGDATQIISPGGRAVYSYDLQGRELWRVQHRGFSVAPRPVFGHNLVFVVIDRDQPELWAIRPDGQGDVTDTHVAWKHLNSMPPRCSPLLIGDLLYIMNRDGVATCLDAKTGERVWRERLRGKYSASPIYAQGHIYLFNDDATTTIIRPGRKLEVVASNSLSRQQLRATPAIDENAWILRTENYLYRIENGTTKQSPTKTTKNTFIGKWDIGKSTPTSAPKFVMTLNADFTARKSHAPKATGRWQLVNGEARVVWSDGWRDILRAEGERFRKIAFRPGTDFDDSPDNQDPAERSAK
ncbi:MAG: quinonprotein alcohol dehydrogenase [Blastopirellula sp.]|nr:quinonprotein alcohol dehydrogenase [Blastopirellula sp.]